MILFFAMYEVLEDAMLLAQDLITLFQQCFELSDLECLGRKLVQLRISNRMPGRFSFVANRHTLTEVPDIAGLLSCG